MIKEEGSTRNFILHINLNAIIPKLGRRKASGCRTEGAALSVCLRAPLCGEGCRAHDQDQSTLLSANLSSPRAFLQISDCFFLAFLWCPGISSRFSFFLITPAALVKVTQVICDVCACGVLTVHEKWLTLWDALIYFPVSSVSTNCVRSCGRDHRSQIFSQLISLVYYGKEWVILVAIMKTEK